MKSRMSVGIHNLSSFIFCPNKNTELDPFFVLIKTKINKYFQRVVFWIVLYFFVLS